MSSTRLEYLYRQIMDQRATPEERAEFLDLKADPAHEADFRTLIAQAFTEDKKLEGLSNEKRNQILQSILSNPKTKYIPKEIPLLRSNVRPVFKWVAAAAIAGISFGTYYFFNISKKPAEPIISQTKTGDIAPGSNKATLTLGNGSTIVLDSAQNGLLVTQKGSSVIKTDSGRLVYNTNTSKETTIVYNTLSTPRGGQYQLALPDGTHVWLNSASTITYPTALNGKDRKVSMTGEVYFEVAHNSKQPFSVSVNGTWIHDIGTQFNINAYADEKNIKTTLLEGSVQIVNNKKQVVLVPGQQGITNSQTSGAIKVLNDVDMDKVVAWKNGWFKLEKTSLDVILRQISRWYDVDIKYEGAPSDVQFGGRISKNLPLSKLIESLESGSNGIKFSIEGKTLVVRNN